MTLVTFPTREEIAPTLRAATYFSEMSALDLRARKADSTNAYLTTYERSIVPLSKKQKDAIEHLAYGVDNLTKAYKRLYAIPWKIAAFRGVEHDFPHTIADIVFLPIDILDDTPKSAMETLLHEKIHVYQRVFPLETNVLVQKMWGYKMHSLRSRHNLSRSNPDLNRVVYGKQRWGMVQEFTNTANDLRDSKVQFVGEQPDTWTAVAESYEHPYERMAYEISKFLVSGSTKEDKTQLAEWMAKYF
jgi:hypothetical protein